MSSFVLEIINIDLKRRLETLLNESSLNECPIWICNSEIYAWHDVKMSFKQTMTLE